METYSSINNGPGTRRFYPTTPAPIYEDPEDTPFQPTYGSQRPLFEVLNTPFVSARSNNVVHIGYTQPYSRMVQNRVLFQPAYNPVANTNRLAPVTYTTHTHSSPLVNSNIGQVVATTYGQPAFSSHNAVASQLAKSTITYSEAPLVSHTTFTGQGARFAW